MLSAAPFHTCVMTSSGGVKCWGYQSQGALGDGQDGSLGAGSTATPASVIGVSGVSSIATGYQVSCAVIAADGSVKCWGRGTYGVLGNGQTEQSTSAVNVQESAGVLRACLLFLEVSSIFAAYSQLVDGWFAGVTTTQVNLATDLKQIAPGLSWSRKLMGRP
jgi:hypothetical protein